MAVSIIFLSKDITPYMHILSNHLTEATRLHGHVVDFCQQGLEKLNDTITKWYFRSTNCNKTALTQIMHEQHRTCKLKRKCRHAQSFKWLALLVIKVGIICKLAILKRMPKMPCTIRQLLLSKDITAYMHILSKHLPDAMQLQGNVDFCQHGLEKLKDMITKWYLRSTNSNKNWHLYRS